jgi:selenocysteine lyase/cysteine desulfurase
MTLGRREFISQAALATSLPFLSGSTDLVAGPSDRPLVDVSRTPAALATDDPAWADVQAAWAIDRSIINLENGGVQPSPECVNTAFVQHWRHAHRAPPVTFNREQLPQLEEVRKRLACAFGCDAEEIALTRNTTEGVETVLLGWDLRPGEHILTTTQDYWRFHDTLKQRASRDNLAVDVIRLPPPDAGTEEIIAAFDSALSFRTRLVLLSQVVNLTGRILPVRELVRHLRDRGVAVVVDGAHGFAHLPAQRDDLDCDFYATSLHKWLGAPHGTGFLYVRRERIAPLWPHFPAPAERRENIRKFESLGTIPAAPFLAIQSALDFHAAIGAEPKLARLRWLRDRWLVALAGHTDFVRHAGREFAASGALMTVTLPGLPAAALARWLWERHRLVVRPIDHPEFTGIRVTPNLYTTTAEIDRLSEALREALHRGLNH